MKEALRRLGLACRVVISIIKGDLATATSLILMFYGNPVVAISNYIEVDFAAGAISPPFAEGTTLWAFNHSVITIDE